MLIAIKKHHTELSNTEKYREGNKGSHQDLSPTTHARTHHASFSHWAFHEILK
jgi:hypothetical protein